MKPERWQQLEKLFHSALGRGLAQRGEFLDEACDDEPLRKEVEALLAVSRGGWGSFIAGPRRSRHRCVGPHMLVIAYIS